MEKDAPKKGLELSRPHPAADGYRIACSSNNSSMYLTTSDRDPQFYTDRSVR